LVRQFRKTAGVDIIDQAILRILQANCTLSSAHVAQEVGLSVSAANERIRRLNSSGAIQANRAAIDPAAVDFGLCTFIFVDLAGSDDDEEAFVAGAVATPEIQEVHHITGSHSYLIKVRTRGTAELQALLSSRLKRLPGVVRTESIVVLETRKETSELPIGVAADRS
jgi:Lrp/AsnC family leucine-responsive transcriptional regulator